MVKFIYINGNEIGYIQNNITYIDTMLISFEGRYHSGHNYLIKRCIKLEIELINSSYIRFNDFKNILIPSANQPHRKNLLIFLQKIIKHKNNLV